MHLTRRRTSEIASLARRRYRDRLNQFVIEGARAVESAVAAGADITEVVHLTDATGDARIETILSRVTAPIYAVDDDVFARFSDVETAQGILAVATIPEIRLEDVLASDRLLAFDALQDPGNVGTLIRTAAWFGIPAAIAGKGTADVYSSKTVRATTGGIFDVAVARAENLAEVLSEAAATGFEIVGADMSGEPVDEWKPARRTILVVGNEGSGLSPEVAETLHRRLTIPPGGTQRGVESLNVAIAAGVIMHAWTHI